MKLIAGGLVDQSLLSIAQQDIATLQQEVQLLKPHEYAKKVQLLINLSSRLNALEIKVDAAQKQSAANAHEIAANKDRIAAVVADMTVNTTGVAVNKDRIAAVITDTTANTTGVAANKVSIIVTGFVPRL